MDQFGQTTVADGQQWQSAWEAAGQPEDYDTSIHLTNYLLDCQRLGHEPQPGRWLRFLMENREQFRQKMTTAMREADREVREYERAKAHTQDLRNHTFEPAGFAEWEAEQQAAKAARLNGQQP